MLELTLAREPACNIAEPEMGQNQVLARSPAKELRRPPDSVIDFLQGYMDTYKPPMCSKNAGMVPAHPPTHTDTDTDTDTHTHTHR